MATTTVKKTNRLLLKTACGTVELEILQLTKNGVNARDVRHAGQAPLATGWMGWGIQAFWKDVRAGILSVK